MTKMTSGSSLTTAALLLCLMVVFSKATNSVTDTRTAYVEVPVDHFSFASKDTFKVRYLISDIHYKGGDHPIFLYTGNEGNITLFSESAGILFDWAEEFGAMVVFVEHRYYGESMPYGQQSYDSLEKLGFLTVEQALADFALAIDHVKNTEGVSVGGAKSSPVVGFGGSYGGMLCAWLRMKYPHKIIGCLSASAPILMFNDMVECNAFKRRVTDDFKKPGVNCANNIRKSWAIIDKMTSTDEGKKKMSETFKLCDPLLTNSDVGSFKSWIAGNYDYLAMVDYPYPANFLNPLPGFPIKTGCQKLLADDLSDQGIIEGVSFLNNMYWNHTGNQKCINNKKQVTKKLSGDGWYFQACGEMPMPFCSDGISDMFEPYQWKIDDFAEECKNKFFGMKMKKTWIKELFGGKDITAFSNIIFSNGDLDPWAPGGVTITRSDTLISIMIEGGAHHVDLRHAHPLDPPSFIEARKKEKEIIKEWIRESIFNMGQHEPNCKLTGTYSKIYEFLNHKYMLMLMALIAAFMVTLIVLSIGKGVKAEQKSTYVYTDPPKIKIVPAIKAADNEEKAAPSEEKA